MEERVCDRQIDLTDANLSQICRLCLKAENIAGNILTANQNSEQNTPLDTEIYKLFQIKVAKEDGLPTNICSPCLCFVRSVGDFSNKVRICEDRLQLFLQTKSERTNSQPRDMLCLNNFEPDDNCIVTVIDPNGECESSDDDFSMDSDTEEVSPPQPLPAKLQHVIPTESSCAVSPGDVPKNTFFCQYCDIAFTMQSDCAQHEARHDPVNPFMCNYCSYRTTTRQMLIQHIKESHNNDRPFVCVACNKGFCRRSDLKKHAIVHTGVKPFTCPICHKTFSRNTNLTKHLKIHTEAKTHPCDKCPRAFISSGDLIRHQRMHIINKQYKCGKCDHVSTSRDKLFAHQKIHSAPAVAPPPQQPFLPEIPFNRPYPGAPFEPHVPSLLHSHLTRDTFGQSESLLNCHDCSQRFTKRRDLERHQLLVHPDKLLSCKVCSKKFNRRDKLIRHERMHTEQRIFACSKCDLSFSKEEALDMHVKVNHPETGLLPPAMYSNPFQPSYPPRGMGLGFYSEIRSED